jgi:hypothetical protein
LGFGGDEKKVEAVTATEKPKSTSEMSLEELKALREKTAAAGPRTKNVQSIESHDEKLRTIDMAIAQKQPAVEPKATANTIESKTTELNNAKDAAANPTQKGNTVVNSPTSVVNNNTTQAARKSVRSDEPSANRFFNSRYGT